jgi:hypothetical protein
MSHILRLTAASIALLAPCALACGESDDEGDRPSSTRIESQLDEELAQALDFWWEQGQGTRAEHLVLASADSGRTLRLVVFEVPVEGAGRQRLFGATPAGAAFSRFDAGLVREVNQAVSATVSERIANELGGRATFERAVQAGLDAGGIEPLDTVVIGSALLALPASLVEGERDVLLDTLTFAHAAARRREAESGDAAAYFAAYGDTLDSVGWVSASRESGALATGSTLLAGVAPLASAEPWLRALGLIE